MSRNFKKADTNLVFTHPDIIDISISEQETFINYIKQVKSKKQVEKRKVQNKNEKKGRRKGKYQEDKEDEEDLGDEKDKKADQLRDEAKANDGAATALGKEPTAGKNNNKKLTLPDFLECSAKYNFKDKTVILCFYDEDLEWSRVSITGSYEFSKTNIREMEFEEITGNDFVYNIEPSGTKAKTFKLKIAKINRHVLMHQFSVNVHYLFLQDLGMQIFNSKYTFEVPFFQQETRLQFKFLGHYHADKRITSLYNYKFKKHQEIQLSELQLLRELDQYQRENLSERNSGNSTQMIKYALNIEDLSDQDELKAFTVKDIELKGLMNRYWFRLERKKLPPNPDEMSLCLVPMNKYKEGMINYEDDCIFAQVDKYQNGEIHFEKNFPVQRDARRAQQAIDLKVKYFLRFIPNRITYRSCFHALDSIHNRLLRDYFDAFETEPMNCKRENYDLFDKFEWYNPQISTNEEQMTAIKNIVNCTAYPFPYVVFGPPGTGKTSCIVECIAQILKLKPKSRIMVTAQSNSACDEVGVRLLKYISPNKIFRFYSPSLLNPENGETSAELRRTSNLRKNQNQNPTKEEFSHFNVVIVTLMSCSRLVQLEQEDINRNFDYIFVDECAAATEPESCVPIIGLGTDFQEITSNIILLGDHKQLGPVISSEIAARLGLSVSLMERIMSKRRYRMNDLDKSYDKNYVTQLLDNFRSHPAILQFSNVLFYESKLRAKIGEPERSFGTKWMYLNNKQFPVLFHCVKEPSKIVEGGTSSYNDGEIKMVNFYVDLLLNTSIAGNKVSQKDIGIVSPYKAQLNKLRASLLHAPDVEIGTAEYYQGREKKIIIISTVKSRNSVGFLKNEKRLNVCITRAKSLLILVGNADTLQQDPLWNSFMHFCKANLACVGEEFALKKQTDEEVKLQEDLRRVFDQPAMYENEEGQVEVIKMGERLEALHKRMELVAQLAKKL